MMAGTPLVFIVDDEPSVRKSLKRLLASAGYGVEAFASAREFLARERHPGPCCLVLDVRMPGLTGLDLQEALAGAGLSICRAMGPRLFRSMGPACRPQDGCTTGSKPVQLLSARSEGWVGAERGLRAS